MAVKGIPALLNKVGGVTNTVTLLVADAKRVLGFFKASEWGIYGSDGKLAIKPDSIVAVDFKREFRIADYPQENGAFQAYNKVATPDDVRVTMTKGGKTSDRTDFLNALGDISKSLDLYSVVVPEGKYSSMNVSHIDYRRTAKSGVSLLTVDVWMQKVRVTATAKSNATKDASGADAKSAGNVQPQAATPAQQSTAAKAQ